MNKQEALKKIEELKKYVEECDKVNKNNFFTFTNRSEITTPHIYKDSDEELFGTKIDEDSDVEVWKDGISLFFRLKKGETQ